MGQVIVIGGGLAGLSSAILLARAGLEVTLIEKKKYPFHRVCGEYISNEALPFLETLGLDLNALKPARINQFQLTSPSGKMLEAPLDLGGFGISRFALDHELYKLGQRHGVKFKLQTTAERVTFSGQEFTVALSDGSVLQSEIVAGAFGKRSNLDRHLNRPFFAARSPYLAVKYHLKTDLPKNVIALHNFENGYAGISAIENDRYCFCYLTTRQNLKTHKTVAKMEEKVLCQNPHLQKIFRESEFLYPQPEVINEISFAPKTAVAGHVLCAGDAAGLITPLCGNGMAMAFHSGKILAEEIAAYFQHRNRTFLEASYTQAWENQFNARLRVGRAVQQVFGKKILSEIAVSALQKMPFAVQLIMKNTHGKPF
jgi:flavin-dependent dehydrogenase